MKDLLKFMLGLLKLKSRVILSVRCVVRLVKFEGILDGTELSVKHIILKSKIENHERV
jgi:hypothetical protein